MNVLDYAILEPLFEFLTFEEITNMVPDKWWKHPLTKDFKLTWFWRVFLKRHWKEFIATNQLTQMIHRYHWRPETWHPIYDELYRLFYQEHPEGPGTPAVETKSKPVDLVPTFYVSSPDHFYPDPESLFVYHLIASLCSLNFTGITLKWYAQRKEFTSPWFKQIPYTPNITIEPIGDKYVIETQGFQRIEKPSVTNRDRFEFSRFLFDYIRTYPFHVIIHAKRISNKERDLIFNLLRVRQWSVQFHDVSSQSYTAFVESKKK